MIKSNEPSTANIHINFPKVLGAKISDWPHSHPAAPLPFTAAVVCTNSSTTVCIILHKSLLGIKALVSLILCCSATYFPWLTVTVSTIKGFRNDCRHFVLLPYPGQFSHFNIVRMFFLNFGRLTLCARTILCILYILCYMFNEPEQKQMTV